MAELSLVEKVAAKVWLKPAERSQGALAWFGVLANFMGAALVAMAAGEHEAAEEFKWLGKVADIRGRMAGGVM